MFALLGVLAVLGAALGISSAYRERRTLSLLNQRTTAAKAQADEVEALKTELTTLQNQLQVFKGIAEERGRAVLVLREVVRLLPADVYLTELTLDGNRLQIRGSTATSASELIAAFERSSLFENAAFTSPISAQGKDRQGFHLQTFVRTSPSTGASTSSASRVPRAAGSRDSGSGGTEEPRRQRTRR